MKKLIFLLTLLLSSWFSQAGDLAAVDRAVRAYPKSFAAPPQLADRINQDFDDPTDKARALFTWIALNVSYDLNEYRDVSRGRVAFRYTDEDDKNRKLRRYNLDLANKTLRTKKGVCRGYAALYDVVAYLVGLDATTIPGTSKTSPSHIGKMPTSNDHVWNAVRINGRWQMLDVTWGSGAVDTSNGKFQPRFNDGYFFTDPYVFFLNHYPEDRQWLPNELSASLFARLPLFYGPYMDSGYTLTFPKSGVLPSGYVVPVTFENLAADKIAYTLGDGEFQVVSAIRDGSTSVFEIPIDRKARGYLTIYVGRDCIATFKVEGGKMVVGR